MMRAATDPKEVEDPIRLLEHEDAIRMWGDGRKRGSGKGDA
jgi:hypothetical protein